MSFRGPPSDVSRMISLKVDNLTYRTTDRDLEYLFEKYGKVGDIYIPKDRNTRESRGFAFVRFFDQRDAEDAMDGLDGRMYDGRDLRIQMAKYGRPEPRGGRGRSRSRSRDRRRRSRSRSRRSRSRSRSRRRDSRSRSRSASRRDKSGSKSPSREKSRTKSRSRSRD